MIRGLGAWAWFAMGAMAAEESSSLLRFSNEDQLPGSLESLSGEQVVWASPIQTKPTAFWLKEVLDMSLPAEVPLTKATHEATLTLARGDSVKGEIASVTDEAIELDTWFAGRMKFPRVMVREVKIADRPQLLFRGPSSLEGWTQSTEPAPWKFQNGSFRSLGAGSIGRDIELPDEFRLAFEAGWKSHFNLSVIFFSDDVSTEAPDNGYEMTFQGRSVRLQRCGNHNFVGSPTQGALDLQRDEKARIEIRASLRTKTICFYVNGKIIEIWKDEGLDREALGRAIHFVNQDNAQIKISGIEVAAWDGMLDETPPAGNAFANRFRNLEFGGEREEGGPVPKEKSEEGRMMLRNGDSVAGEVVSIADGMITLKTSFDEIKLPVSRFRSIALKPVSLEEPKRMPGDVRGWFMDGSSLVFRLDAFDKDRVKGYSQNFGTVDFSLKAFSRLEFNIYSPKLDALRRQNDW